MDPEGARLLTYSSKPRLAPAHKYLSLRSTAHRAAAARWATRTAPASAGSILVKVQCQVLNR